MLLLSENHVFNSRVNSAADICLTLVVCHYVLVDVATVLLLLFFPVLRLSCGCSHRREFMICRSPSPPLFCHPFGIVGFPSLIVYSLWQCIALRSCEFRFFSCSLSCSLSPPPPPPPPRPWLCASKCIANVGTHTFPHLHHCSTPFLLYPPYLLLPPPPPCSSDINLRLSLSLSLSHYHNCSTAVRTHIYISKSKRKHSSG